MDEQTAKLIESLSAKLGTTTEYLWGVLLQQAKVSAIISSINAALLLLSAAVYVVWVHRTNKKMEDLEEWMDNLPLGLAGMFGGVYAIFAVVFGVQYLQKAIIAFTNPEYWAIEQILGTLK